MKKKLLFAAIAIMTMASCSDNDYVGDKAALSVGAGDGAISFNLNVPSITRADKVGSAAAADLNEHFYVYGIKKESVDGAGNVQDGNLVFNNYAVNWATNSAMTTTSNTANWEYVGYTLTAKEQERITVNSGDVAQTIKYWDWGAADYTFYAFSALPADISGDKITVAKVQDQKTTDVPAHTVYDNGYTVTLAADASLDNLYFSERVNIVKSEGTNASNTNRQAENTYGGNVTFRFHNMATKVRVAMYENIPGYKVTLNSFKVEDNASPTFPTMTTAETGAFKANFVNNAGGTAGTMSVKYVSEDGATKNHPTVSFTPTGTAANILTLGDQLKAGVDLGTSVTGATYDKAEKAYTSVFPKEDNTQSLKLKVCYTLTAPVTGETIVVTDATAEVPADYLKWKPGYAYTYIFKISDNTNGSTGDPSTNPAGLYPITFDAIETIDADGMAEYITTVSEPSITTFGYDATNKKFVTDGSEYAANSDIYATFMEGSTVQTPTIGGDGAQHVNIFKVTTPDATHFPITEASVAEAIANPGSITHNVYTCTVTYTKVTDATTLAAGTNYYKSDGAHAPGTTDYVPTLAVSETDYHVDATPANSTIAAGVDIYTCAVTSVTEVTDATTLAPGTTYYKKDTNTKAPDAVGYIPTIAVEGTDYEVAPKIKATKINDDASTNFTAAPAKVTTVPGEDGVNKTIDAVKLTGVKAGTYAIEYEASAAWTGSYKKVYKVIVVQ